MIDGKPKFDELSEIDLDRLSGSVKYIVGILIPRRELALQSFFN